MADTVSVVVDAHIANVVLDRPDKMNAVNLEMFAQLREAGERLAADSRVRAIVLSGAGGAFCAGIDTSIFDPRNPAVGPEAMAAQAPSPANLFQRAAFIWQEVPVPVICAIHGVAYGAGLQIALGADIRYAGPAARFSIMEARWGLVPDMAITVTARHNVPLDRLCELAWTARTVDAGEALQARLVTAVHEDPLAAAQATAGEIAARSPSAVRAMKKLFSAGWQAPVAEALRLEADLQMQVMGGKDQREAVLANLEKRAPDFAD